MLGEDSRYERGGREERPRVADYAWGAGVDQSDQSDRGGGGLYGGLDQVKLQGTGIFIQNSNQSQSKCKGTSRRI